MWMAAGSSKSPISAGSRRSRSFRRMGRRWFFVPTAMPKSATSSTCLRPIGSLADCPAQVAQQVGAVVPDERPELPGTYGVGMKAPISLDAPAQIRTAPRSQTITATEPPHQAEDAHSLFVFACLAPGAGEA